MSSIFTSFSTFSVTSRHFFTCTVLKYSQCFVRELLYFEDIKLSNQLQYWRAFFVVGWMGSGFVFICKYAFLSVYFHLVGSTDLLHLKGLHSLTNGTRGLLAHLSSHQSLDLSAIHKRLIGHYKKRPDKGMDLKFSWDCRPLLAPGSKFLWAAGSMFSLQPGNSPLKHRSIDKYVRNQKKKGIIAETRRKVVTPQSTVHTSCNCKNLIKAISSFSLSILISKDLLNAR